MLKVYVQLTFTGLLCLNLHLGKDEYGKKSTERLTMKLVCLFFIKSNQNEAQTEFRGAFSPGSTTIKEKLTTYSVSSAICRDATPAALLCVTENSHTSSLIIIFSFL